MNAKPTLVLLLLCCLAACTKPDEPVDPAPPPPHVYPVVKIDSSSVYAFDNVVLSAAVQNSPSDTITSRGFYWGPKPDPTGSDSTRLIPDGRPFMDTLKSIGQLSSFYIRAFAKTKDSIFYSASLSVKTGGVLRNWDKEYNINKNGSLVQVITTADNAFLELIQVFGDPLSWTLITKVDTSGSVFWSREYNQKEWKEPNAVIQAKDGYLFATTNWTNNGRGIFLTKLDLNGNKLWEKSFNRNVNQEFVRLTLLAGDSVQLTTKAFDALTSGGRQNSSINDFFVAQDGTLRSERSVLIGNNKFAEGSYAFKALTVPQDGFVTTNYYSPLNSGSGYDIIVQKYDQQNKVNWEKVYGNSGDDFPFGLVIAKNQNYTILGYNDGANRSNQNTWLFELDKNSGSKRWELTYRNNKFGNFGNTYTQALNQDADGAYYMAGDLSNYSDPGVKGYIVKVSEDGRQLWDYTYQHRDRNGNDRTQVVITNSNKEIYLFGARIFNTSASSNPMFISKFTEY